MKKIKKVASRVRTAKRYVTNISEVEVMSVLKIFAPRGVATIGEIRKMATHLRVRPIHLVRALQGKRFTDRGLRVKVARDGEKQWMFPVTRRKR